MAKKAMAVLLVLGVVLMFGACKNSGNRLAGTWVLVQGSGGHYGQALFFGTDGVFLCTAGSAVSARNVKSVLLRSADFITMTYEVKNDKTLKLTVTALFETFESELGYKLEGDVLVLEGSIYQRQ
jgi:hypothetical protein